MRRAPGILAAAVVATAAGCTMPPPGSDVLVIAYTDVDGIDGFDEAGGGVLIAELVDSNDDAVVSTCASRSGAVSWATSSAADRGRCRSVTPLMPTVDPADGHRPLAGPHGTASA